MIAPGSHSQQAHSSPTVAKISPVVGRDKRVVENGLALLKNVLDRDLWDKP